MIDVGVVRLLVVLGGVDMVVMMMMTHMKIFSGAGETWNASGAGAWCRNVCGPTRDH